MNVRTYRNAIDHLNHVFNADRHACVCSAEGEFFVERLRRVLTSAKAATLQVKRLRKDEKQRGREEIAKIETWLTGESADWVESLDRKAAKTDAERKAKTRLITVEQPPVPVDSPRFVDMVKIEGESCPERTVDSIEAADQILKEIAANRSPCGGYDKTWFEITLCDGSKYAGRIDVKYINEPQETANGRLGILNHIRDAVLFYGGFRRPDHIDAVSYQGILKATKSEERRPELLKWAAWLGIDLTI